MFHISGNRQMRNDGRQQFYFITKMPFAVPCLGKERSFLSKDPRIYYYLSRSPCLCLFLFSKQTITLNFKKAPFSVTIFQKPT